MRQDRLPIKGKNGDCAHICSKRSAPPTKSQVTLSKLLSQNRFSTPTTPLWFPKGPYLLERLPGLNRLALLGVRESFAFDFGNCSSPTASPNLSKVPSPEWIRINQQIYKWTPNAASSQKHKTA